MKNIHVIIKFFNIVLMAGLIARNIFSTELPRGRAMWVWNSENVVNDMVNDVGNTRDELFEFCRSPHGNPEHHITVLFLDCKHALYENQDNLRDFLNDATSNGLTVEYLDGDPSWATYNQDVGFDRLNKVIEFNASATVESEKLKGVQFDVEPYLLKSSSGYRPPYWDVNLDSVWALYVAYLDSCQSVIDSNSTDTYFGAAIPRWYENKVGNTKLYRLQSLVDYVAIMDYNEKSSVIINDAANEINNSTALNKRVWIGVETKNVSPEPETVTFFEEGLDYMESQLSAVISAYGDKAAFSGIAIHAYRYYKSMASTEALGDEPSPEYKINLFQNVENPFRMGTTIQYDLPVPMRINIKVFNVLGQEIAVLADSFQFQGKHAVFWDATNFPSGIYFYQLQTPEVTYFKKMLVIH